MHEGARPHGVGVGVGAAYLAVRRDARRTSLCRAVRAAYDEPSARAWVEYIGVAGGAASRGCVRQAPALPAHPPLLQGREGSPRLAAVSKRTRVAIYISIFYLSIYLFICIDR